MEGTAMPGRYIPVIDLLFRIEMQLKDCVCILDEMLGDTDQDFYESLEEMKEHASLQYVCNRLSEIVGKIESLSKETKLNI
jgi:hypothetical protein